ncbi:MAG: hypothetical protein AB1791_11315 [Chloroflexota bacterium]
MRFEWQKDVEDWVETPAAGGRSVHSRRWSYLALLGLTVAVAGSFLVWRLNERVKLGTAAVRADVLAAFDLVWQAIANGDLELFNSLLAADADSTWAEAQRDLVSHRLLLDRLALGLFLQAGLPRVESVTLTPDLQEAEVNYTLPYRVVEGYEPEGLVELQHTAVFQQVGRRWLLSPPGPSFWQSWVVEQRPSLNLVFPGRDKALGERLAADLEAQWVELCAIQTGTGCPADFRLNVQLQPSPASLAVLGNQPLAANLNVGWDAVLPAPTLLGLPVDEAGYQALLHSYTLLLTKALAGSRLCCPPDALQAQLAALGVAPPATAVQGDPPIPWPDQDVQLLCAAGSEATLYRWNLVTGAVTPELTHAVFTASLNGLPNDDGVILRQEPIRAGAPRSRTTLWQGGTEYLVYNGQALHGLVSPFGLGDPGGRRLPTFVYDVLAGEAHYTLLNLDSCSLARCGSPVAAGWPFWSPDGRRTLVWVDEQTLFDGDAAGRPLREIGPGYAPFWIDNETVGYAHTTEEGLDVIQAIHLTETGELGLVFLTSEALRGSIAAAERPADLTVSYVAVSPADSHRWYVLANSSDGHGYLFAFDWLNEGNSEEEPGMVTLLLTVRPAPIIFPPFLLSPDGRWLTATTYDLDSNLRTLYVYDTAQEETRVFTADGRATPGYDWSADGRWLLFLENNDLDLIAPSFDYQLSLPHELEGCSGALWVY